MGRKPVLTYENVYEHLKNGLTQNEIAHTEGVSKQAVAAFIKRYPELQTPRQLVAKHFPWQVPAEMNFTSPYLRMRDHGEWWVTNGKGMSKYKIDRLRWWYRMMWKENVVLEFDPNIPPIEGVSNKGGFAYRPREESDENFLIRKNGYTHMTTEGEHIWVLPRLEDIP
ncbi:XRE family transcriptional regulator [Nocardia sp. NPDC059246]|uniref:XRE family transcriptional regulator n=1 Tax=unclassified Nocardia TaxID=2637762 RepID=UPI00368F0795